MKKIELREEQLIELEILKCFAEFCDTNNLKYYLDSGTLIGAIRHEGFIPWDDDIDVCMLRNDYERFIQLMAKKNNRLNEYIVLELESQSIYPYLKLVDTRTVLVEYPNSNPIETGIYIDIFPKDGVMSFAKSEIRRVKKIRRYCLKYWIGVFSIPKWIKGGGVKAVIARFIRVLFKNPDRYKVRAIELAKKYDVNTCEYVSSLVCSGFGGCVKKDCFEDRIDVPFEDQSFKVPIGYDVYLKTLYSGDYMVPPPPENRIAHETIVYWKE